MKTDIFNLTWRDFESCSSNSFRGFMARQEFVDVTLVCDDQNQIKAHKVILSACSDFFRNILLRNIDVSQPFIFLDNVSFQDLENVISFMYNGETAIGQEDFNSFMRAAQRLRVKGLSEQYCKEVPGDQDTDTAERRGPRRARYKSVIKKEEPFEPVKYLNVVDALTRSMETPETENEDEEEQRSQSESFFMDYEQYPVARMDRIINIENSAEGENEEDNTDAKEEDVDNDDVGEEDGDDDVVENDEDDEADQKESVTEVINDDQVYEEDVDREEENEEEDLENRAEEEFENEDNDGGDDTEDSKGFFPNENGYYDHSESESDDEGNIDGIEDRFEIEDVYEYINENDGEIFTAGNEEETDNKAEVVKIEMTLPEEEPLSNYVSRLRKRKRGLRRNNIKREAVITDDENVEQ